MTTARKVRESPGLSENQHLIAWNDGPAAAQAIGLANPLIVVAGEVCLLVVEAEPGITPCNLILAYLRRLNSAVTVKSVPAHHNGVGRAILEQADAWGATLLIMGAYEHSRAGEIVFGRATRFLVKHVHCPVAIAR